MIGQSPECFTVYARFPYVLFCTYLGAESPCAMPRLASNLSSTLNAIAIALVQNVTRWSVSCTILAGISEIHEHWKMI